MNSFSIFVWFYLCYFVYLCIQNKTILDTFCFASFFILARYIFFPPKVTEDVQTIPTNPEKINIIQKANDSLSKPSTMDQTDLSPKPVRGGIPIEEQEDFKRMFKDLDYSKLSDMDQAYIRHFYTTEMQKLEDMKRGTYKPKPTRIKPFKKAPKKQKTQVIKIKVPTKKTLPVQPKEAPKVEGSEPKKAPVKQASPLESPAKKEVKPDEKKTETGTLSVGKGVFSRIWAFILSSKLIVLGVVVLFVMSRYAFSMRKLKNQKEKNIMFQNVGYEYEHFNASKEGRGTNRKVLQI